MDVTRDITREVMQTAGIHDTDAEIEVVLDDQGGWRLWISWPRSTGMWFDVYLRGFATIGELTPSPQRETYSILYEAGSKLAREHGDAWYGEELQERESRMRLMRQGAEEVM